MPRITYLGIICLLVGCRSQALPVTNPFVSPAVVPPPATRAPAPGTAAPYYPGDPLPGSSPAAVPAPITTPAPVTPGAWGTSPPLSQTAPSFDPVRQTSANIPLGPTEAVQVPTDNSALRFSQPQVASVPAPATATPGTFNQNSTTPTPHPVLVQPPQEVAPVQFIQQSNAVPLAEQRPVVIREISSQQADRRINDGTSAGGDGFRPQGSSRTAREQQRFSQPVEPQAPARQSSSTATPNRFGYTSDYSALRGQLHQSPGTGQWQLRYLADGAANDQFGGSVAIANPQVLGSLQNGDFVAVQGNLQLVQLGSQATVPTFTIAVLQRQQQDIR